jgi:hypothetical protein
MWLFASRRCFFNSLYHDPVFHNVLHKISLAFLKVLLSCYYRAYLMLHKEFCVYRDIATSLVYFMVNYVG